MILWLWYKKLGLICLRRHAYKCMVSTTDASERAFKNPDHPPTPEDLALPESQGSRSCSSQKKKTCLRAADTELLAFSWPFPPHKVKALQTSDIFLPAQMQLLINNSLQKSLWDEDSRHHLPQHLCDTGK